MAGREFRLSAEADSQRFEALAARLQAALGGEWVSQADGPDQRYWDLQVGDGRITLHMEHYLGISLFAADETPASASLFERAKATLR